MSGIAQILGWLSVVGGAIMLAFGFLFGSVDVALVSSGSGLLIGGVMLGVLGEIATNVEHMCDLAEKRSKTES